MNIFDKYIITNLNMVKTQIVSIVICCIVMIGCTYFSFKILLPFGSIGFICMILGIVIFSQNILIYKKIFYDSIYGSSAVIYNQLPVSPKEIVIGKLTVIGIISLMSAVFSIFIMVFISRTALVNMLIGNVELEQSNIQDFMIPYNFVESIVCSISQGALLLYAIIFYNGISTKKKTTGRLVLTVFMVLMLGMILNNTVKFFTKALKMEYAIWMFYLSIMIDIMILVIMCVLSIKTLEKKYELS